MAYDTTNKGIISRNARKSKDTHPDITGTLDVDGVAYFIDGWKKERNDGSGSFYSLSIKRKEQQRAAPTRAPAPRPAARSDEFDDLPPF